CFSSPGSPPEPMNSAQDTLAGGLPHSEIPGSTIARISPGLFAACHVLHRLSVPRHPPDALNLALEHRTQPQSPSPPQPPAQRPAAGTRCPGPVPEPTEPSCPASPVPGPVSDATRNTPAAPSPLTSTTGTPPAATVR